jgi:hypothetical protein
MIQSLLLKIATSILKHYEAQIITEVDTVAQAEVKKIVGEIASKL